MPGIAASTSDTCEFGAPPNSVEAPENSFALEETWACTSMPMTTSQSPVAPRIRLLPFALISPPPLWRETSSRLLDHFAEREQSLLIEWPSDQLQPERQALRVETGGNGDARQPGHVHGHREYVIEIHLDRIGLALFAKAERGRRRRGREHRIDAVGE